MPLTRLSAGRVGGSQQAICALLALNVPVLPASAAVRSRFRSFSPDPAVDESVERGITGVYQKSESCGSRLSPQLTP
jgi:hypothetical protein